MALDLDRSHGGPPRSITGLCKALAEDGGEVALFVHDPCDCKFADTGCCKLIAGSGRGWRGRWRRDIKAALDGFKPDLVHLHGVWCLPLHFDILECRRRGIPYVVAPRGSLDPWGLGQKSLKKKLALALYQGKDLDRAAAIHATCEMEAGYVRAVGCRADVIISPNGVNFPLALPPRSPRRDGRRRFLFLSRISRKKGLIELVRAWNMVKRDGWFIEIAGNDSEGYWAEVEKEIERLGCGDTIERTPFLDDVRKWEAYARADAFVLPTKTENFGIVIAEALFAAVPAITTKAAPWKGLADNNAGWWIDDGVEPLCAAMCAAMDKTDEERAAMGGRGREYVVREFDWRNIARGLWGKYENILRRRKKP